MRTLRRRGLWAALRRGGMLAVAVVGLAVWQAPVAGAQQVPPGSQAASAIKTARDYLKANGLDRSSTNPGAMRLAAAQVDQLEVKDVVTSLSGTHVRFEQRVNGIRVYGADVTVHVEDKSGEVNATGKFSPAAATAPRNLRIDEPRAVDIARKSVGATGALRGSATTEQVIVPVANGARLAWEVTLPVLQPIADWQVLVDAENGTILQRENLVRSDERAAQAAPTTTTSTPVPAKKALGVAGAQNAATQASESAAKRQAPTTARSALGDRAAVVASEGFEGAWPNAGWTVFDASGGVSPVCWGRNSFQTFIGSFSAWPAAGCSGGRNPAGSTYPNNMNSWAIYGPFSLSGASAASLRFSFWNQSEFDFDYFFWGASTDGMNFDGVAFTGATTTAEPPTGIGWQQRTLDLAAVPNRGSLLGQPSVYIAFVFTSDASITDNGAFLDEVYLDITGGPSCALGPSAGSGLIFNPNPVASSGDTSLTDAGDSDYPALNDKRVRLPFTRLHSTGKLQGDFADLTAPGIVGGYLPAGRACSNDGVYDYPRSDDRFEEAMSYYHVTAAQLYLQSLGFTTANNRSTPIHAHYFPDANAFYSSSDRGLHFGDGGPNGVDFGEDGEVIVHEYGHAILDNIIPNITGNEGGAVHEGFSDYLSASLTAAGNVSSQVLCLGDWVARTIGPPCVRRMDSTKHYPEDLVGEVHADGEIWSAVLWQIYQGLGPTKADKVILEGLYFTNPRANFSDAAYGVLQADQALYGGVDKPLLRNYFVARGILPAACGPAGLNVNPASPRQIGTVVTLTGSTSGCTTPEFRFWQQAPDGTFTVIRDWSTTNTFQWQTAGLAAGNYTLRVSVRVQGSPFNDSFLDVPYQLTSTPPCTGASISPSPASPQLVGQVVTITGSATGCPGPEFRFWVQNPAGVFSILRDWSTVDTATWNTAGLAAGDYTLRVSARSPGSGASQAFVDTTYRLNAAPTCTSATLTPNPTSPQLVGTPVNLSATASGCPSPEFRFWQGSPTGTFSIIRDWSATNTAPWTTTGLATGTWTLRVSVRQAGAASGQAFVDVPFTLTAQPACTGATLTPNPTSPQVVGTPVNLSATASGCPSPEFRFWQGSPTGTFSIIRDWSTTNTAPWTTTGLATGTWTLRVSVRQAGAASGQAFVDVPFTLSSQPVCTSVTLNANPASPQAIGASVLLTGTASCGGAAAEYRFWQQAPNGTWTMLRDWSTTNTFTWPTSGLSAGGYTLRVSARSVGAAAGQTFVDQSFTLTP